ncbi:MAG: type II toxin-antitoxin system VapC family toxin [Myxococcales bacterium]|nr:type II toxin-antitoxin system VapC family toxin [Myxococcales bacterium]
MILVDTSVWIDHERATTRSAPLVELLATMQVLVHPFVIGELALRKAGRAGDAFLGNLWRLPLAPVLDDRQILAMIKTHRLEGSGIGWVDAHLLGAAMVSADGLWTFDRRLGLVAARTNVGGLVRH